MTYNEFQDVLEQSGLLRDGNTVWSAYYRWARDNGREDVRRTLVETRHYQRNVARCLRAGVLNGAMWIGSIP